MGEAKTHCEVIVVGAGHEEGTVRYFVYNGGTPKFIGIIKDVAAKGYQEIEFRSGSGANVQAATASAPTWTFANWRALRECHKQLDAHPKETHERAEPLAVHHRPRCAQKP